ncbi:MAG: TetR/AcrR family transcriptional regulator [Candidatus Aminicenantes bacterium]|nr:TetR/AcrR family transcriptional regulator [Candidatus Aminicenantes bacterium]
MGPADPFRDRIVETARGLFFRSGFNRVTMDEIASRLGIGKATLYTVFAGKEDLLLAVVRRTIGETMTRIEAAASDRKAGFVERVSALMATIGTLFASISPLFLDDLRRSAPHIWTAIDAFRREKLRANFSLVLRGGIDDGVFRGDVDIDLVLDMYIGLVERYLNPDAILRYGRPASDLFGAILQVFFQGLLTNRGRSEFSRRLPRSIPPAKDGRS